MNKNHLSLFQAVAEEGSFSRGAERLYISQPAVSKQVAEFEAAIGLQLLERIPRGVRLTEAGRVLLGYARRMAALEAEAERALDDLRGMTRGRLAVGASTTVGIYLLPEVFGAFRRLHPGIELLLEIGNTESIQSLVWDGTVDIGLTEGLADGTDLEHSVFMDDELVVIAAPSHALFLENSVTASRLSTEPIILREIGSGTRAVVERAFLEQGVSLKLLMSLGSTEAIKRAVSAGVGIAVVSLLAIGIEVEMGRLKIIPLSDLRIHRPLHCLRRHGVEDRPLVSVFVRLLAELTGAVPRGA